MTAGNLGLLGALQRQREQQLAQLIHRQAAPYRIGGLQFHPQPMLLRIFDVEHGACAILGSPDRNRIAMIDSGHNNATGWRPSKFIREGLGRQDLDYLFVTNFDQDHISDLDNVCRDVNVLTVTRNITATADQLRGIKQQGGALTNDAERYLALHSGYVHPMDVPFDQGMGGITCSTFCNFYPYFTDTNNLSMMVFLKYAGFKILFAGDMELEGWLAMLRRPDFVAEWIGTNILVASHHGRENGYCAQLFELHHPSAVVMSDKAIAHDTQLMAGSYHAVTRPEGVLVRTTGKRRHVLSSRRDGDILLTVDTRGQYFIDTTEFG